MSTSRTLSQAELLTSPCHHATQLNENLLDQLLREPANQLSVTQSATQLELVHKLPRNVTQLLIASDQSTLEHSIRVSLMARVGAQLMGAESWEHDRVELSGLTHDLGKQRPEINAIVHNGRELTAAERAIVNQHAQYGFEMLYDSQPTRESQLRKKVGAFMGHVALDVLFSHSHARAANQRGVSEKYLADLVNRNVITTDDAVKHITKSSVQLIALADVTDALLSSGMERAYRLHRLRSEGRPAEIDPEVLPTVVGEIIDVPAVNIEKIVPELTSRYGSITRLAQYYARKLQLSQSNR